MSDVEMADSHALGEDPGGRDDVSDEGEGEDLNALSDEDSSEEGATDEEEAQKLRRDFIVDDDPDEDSDVDDNEETRQNKRRKRRRKGTLRLDDEDLELVEENTGTRVTSRSQALSRLRRGRASESASPPPGVSDPLNSGLLTDEESLPDINNISHIFDDDRSRGARGAVEDPDLEDMDAFIEYDDDDVDDEMGDEEREQRRREKRRGEKARKKALDARPELAGIDPGAWDEIFDVFGNGDEYDWALDDDNEGSDTEAAQKEMRYQDVFEPSEIAARFLTGDDDMIRVTDIPERMQLTTSSLSPHASLSTVLNDAFPDEEINKAAEWVATRLSTRVEEEYFTPNGRLHEYLPQLILAVSTTLKYILQEHLEVPYIWTHRRDHISVFEPGQQTKRVVLLERDDLWRVCTLASRYRALYSRKRTLDDTFERMGITDHYYELDILPAINSVDSITDSMEWLSLKYKKPYKDALESAEDGEMRRLKKPSRISQYDFAKDSVISRLAEGFGITSVDIVRNVASNRKQYYTEDHDTTPLFFAEEFISQDAGGPSSAEDALQTARMIIATELGKDPLLRQLTRERFKAGAVISVRPTDKGQNKVDDQHPYAPFKFLRQKPVDKFLNDAQWLHILAAETDHLVMVDISLSQQEEARFRESFVRAFSSDSFSDNANAWNHQRAQVIDEVIEKHLYAVGIKYVREWLRDEVEERVLLRCAHVLEQRVDIAPFRPKEFEKGEIPAVLALSWGKGDPQKDAIYAVFMDEAGHVREHLKFDNLTDPDIRAEFTELVKRRKPDVIAIGGFSVLTIKLWDRVREVIGYSEGQDSSGSGSGPTPTINANGEPDTTPDSLVPIIWVPDQVARLYQHSKRAAEEFGSLPPIGRYCAGLARYIQSPVTEYASLGADIVAVSFSEDQQLLAPEKLLSALERALVNVVNDIGVDINRAVTDPYYRHLLPLVAGLGPRKAQALIKRIGQAGGTMVNRDALILEGGMTMKIFINASGFLRIAQDDYEERGGKDAYGPNRQQDPLDATRIHPEDYDLARKMASGALELDEEDNVNQHPSAPVAQLMQDDNIQRQLDSLGLDEFAQNLLESSNDRKRHILDLIHDELLNPFGELRRDWESMTDWEIVTMLTGETRKTLAPGRILTVTVFRARSTQADVRLDSGLEGYILAKDVADGDPNSLKLRSSVAAVILSMELRSGPSPNISLATRPEAIEKAEKDLKGRQKDVFYDIDSSAAAEHLEERKKQSEANRARRIIKHPAFKNMNSREAEIYLAPLQHGDAIIRPSSKGPEHLAVTWKVADGVYQHLDVLEPNALVPGAGVSQFIVGVNANDPAKFVYSDLDDLLVNHVKAMSRKVDDLMTSEKYKGGSDQDLHNSLTNFVKMNPNRSSYAFGLNKNKPGYFNLSFLANINSPVQTWQVKVTPAAYRLGEVEVGSVPDLCDAFKRKHQKDMRTMANGGKTPYGAGRMTPATGRLPTGMTTSYGAGGAFGKTPNPYQQSKTPAWPPSKTPNPYQPTTAQPLPTVPSTPAHSMGVPAGMNPERWRQIQMQQGTSATSSSPSWGL